jgi:hypothetical protein
MVKNILIRSKDRLNKSDPTHIFQIELPLNFQGKYKLTSCLIPNLFYNCRETNNLIYFYEDNQSKIATLTIKNYTPTEIVNEIQTQLNISSNGYNTYTLSYDTQSGKITFNAIHPFKFEFSNIENSAVALLGFNNEDTLLNTSIVSVNVIELSNPLSVAIKLDSVDTDNFLSGNSVKGSFYIPLNNFGFYQNLYSYQLLQTIQFKNNIRRLKVGILDISTNKLLNLNGGNWEMLLSKV